MELTVRAIIPLVAIAVFYVALVLLGKRER